jgi:hypothetical protein
VAKRGICSRKLIPNRISLIFGSNLRLSFLWDASIFLPFSCCKKEGSASANLSSTKLPKTEPLSPITDGLDFAYASDVAEDDSCEPGHVVELSF